MTLHTLDNYQIKDLNAIISQWNGKPILKTNITKILFDQSENICSIEEETSYRGTFPPAETFPTAETFLTAERFLIYLPKITKDSFTYKTHKSNEESEKISHLWLDAQGDFMITSPDPLKTQVNDNPYGKAGETHLIHSPGMLIFRSKDISLKEINQKFVEFKGT